MPDTLRKNGYTVTVEGTWYEVSNGTEVIEYGNAKEGTTPMQVYERLQEEGLLAQKETNMNGAAMLQEHYESFVGRVLTNPDGELHFLAYNKENDMFTVRYVGVAEDYTNDSLNEEYTPQEVSELAKAYHFPKNIGEQLSDINYINIEKTSSLCANMQKTQDTLPELPQSAKDTYWEHITVSELKGTYPNAKNDVLEEFLKFARNNSNYSTELSQQYLKGIERKYPTEMLADNKYFAVIAGSEYFNSGYAEAMELMNMHQMSDFNKADASAESAIFDKIDEMTDFYKGAMQDCIAEFKSNNQAFKDVELPLPKSLIFPQNKDVTHDDKAAACIKEHTVQATNFRLMKEWNVKSPDYFVITHRIDQPDDVASYKFRTLTADNFEEASKMFDNIVDSGNLELLFPETLTAKELKQQIEQSMSEFKSQHHAYNAKWEEWRGAKEEWINCAMEEDNLSQRAEWSVEACEKQIRTAAQQAINAGIEQASPIHSAREIYAALQPHLDPDGSYLYHAATKLPGFDVAREYTAEDNLHYFEVMNGFGHLRFFEAAKFGECTFKPLQSGFEELNKYFIHSDTLKFKIYQDSTFVVALEGMKRSAALTSDIKECLSGIHDMKNIGTAELTPKALPQEGWVSIDEHMKSYAISLRESDRQEWYEERYQEVVGTGRLYETFHQPDDKVPDAPQLESPATGAPSNKLLNFLQPERETPRLQGELKLLINNTNVMRDYVTSLDKSILEMKGEISQMREHNAQAGREIASGKPVNDWIRLNLSAETKALGLDPEKATFQDLMKALNQNAPQSQPVQENAMEL